MGCLSWFEVRKKVLTRLSTCLPLGALVVVPLLTENYGSIYVLMALPITTLTAYLIGNLSNIDNAPAGKFLLGTYLVSLVKLGKTVLIGTSSL